MQKILLLIILQIFLSSCGESNEDAYIRGYEDGIIEVCYELERINDYFYAELRRNKVCF